MNDVIRAKVAKVLNSREIALNVGREHGVDIDMQFDVLDSRTDQIKDPDTGEVIGALNRPKVRVKVTVVGERFSVARTFLTREVNVGGTIRAPSWNSVERWITEKETILTREETWEDLDPSDRYVSSGDVAIQVPLRLRSSEGQESNQAGDESEELAVS